MDCVLIISVPIQVYVERSTRIFFFREEEIEKNQFINKLFSVQQQCNNNNVAPKLDGIRTFFINFFSSQMQDKDLDLQSLVGLKIQIMSMGILQFWLQML